jgi:hypothetical protein
MMIHNGSLGDARSFSIFEGVGVLRLWILDVHPCAK